MELVEAQVHKEKWYYMEDVKESEKGSHESFICNLM